jgi:hypothetical protein
LLRSATFFSCSSNLAFYSRWSSSGPVD